MFYRGLYTHITAFIKKRPLISFFTTLALLFLIIIIGNVLSKPKPQKTAAVQVKTVHTYNIGETPKAMFQAKIDKSGVVKIVALAPGIVQNIFVSEGDSVARGTQLFTLSSNYQGGNAPALQAQIAKTQYQNVLDTFDQQNNVIQKQRDIGNINHDNFTDMQAIASQSASQTSSLVNTNQTVLDTLNQQLTNDKNNPTAQPATILQEESQINQLQGAQNQLRQALSNLQEQTDSGKPQGRLADTQRDLALAQLDVQQKSLELNKEVSKLQANMAEVNAATMFPASPFSGTVERVYVRVGQQVNPGMPLAEITSTNNKASAIVDVPGYIARNISTLDTSTLYSNNTSYQVRPSFVPTEATDGQLYSIVYPLSDDINISATDGEYVQIAIPVGNVNTSSAVPFVPLDAIYQTQNTNYLLVVQNQKAVTRTVTLGNVFGSYVEVTSGLYTGDQVILDRNIVSGDTVRTN